MRLTVRRKYIWFPFGTPVFCIFCRVSETRVKYKFHSGHFSIGKWKWKNGGGAWKFGTMTTWSATEVVWSATLSLLGLEEDYGGALQTRRGQQVTNRRGADVIPNALTVASTAFEEC